MAPILSNTYIEYFDDPAETIDFSDIRVPLQTVQRAVNARGGLDSLTEDPSWEELGHDLVISRTLTPDEVQAVKPAMASQAEGWVFSNANILKHLLTMP